MRRAAARTSASSTPLIRQYSAIGTADRARDDVVDADGVLGEPRAR